MRVGSPGIRSLPRPYCVDGKTPVSYEVLTEFAGEARDVAKNVPPRPPGLQYDGALIYAFESFELDLDRFELRRAGRPLPLEPRAFDLLRLLIEQGGGVVTKSEILSRVWHQEHVCEGSIHRAVNHLRSVLGQRRRRGGPIETVHRRGYRFASALRITPDPESSAHGEATFVPGPQPSAPDGPFVGRDDVLERLRTRLTQARAGHPQLCVLTGEAGIGKTRCTRELERFARGQGASVWRVSCAAGASEPPLWPWLEILRLCAAEEERSAAFGVELRSVLDEIAASLGEAEEPPDYVDAFPLLDRIAQTVIRAGEWRARVLVIDDLHHMQHAALRVLGLIAATPSRSRLLMLAALRDDRPREENLASAALGRLLRNAERIALQALSPSALAEYVSASELPCSPELASALHAKTRGNPFFLRETLHLLISRHGRTGLAALSGDAIVVPDAVREVVRERIASLDGVARKLLGVASALGEHFEVPLLIEASGLNGSEALGALDQALDQRLIEQSKEFGGYRFSHGLITDTLYEDLSAAERSRIHFAIATALERRAPRQFHALALHFHHALPLGDPLKATTYCRRAAGSAASKGAYDESPRFLRWALEAEQFLPTPDPERHARWTLELARSLYSVGDVHGGRRALTEIIEQASTHRLGDVLAASALLMRPTVEIAWREDPLLQRALREAQTHLGSENIQLQLRVRGCMASVPPVLWDGARSLELVDEVLADARRLGDPRTILEVLRAKAYVLLAPDRLKECLAVTNEILPLVEGVSTSMATETYRLRYTAFLVLGRIAQAEEAFERGREMSEKRPMPALRLGYERRLVARELRMGLLDSARQRLSAIVTEADRRGLSYSSLLHWRAQVELARAGFRSGSVQCLAPPPDLQDLPELQAIHARDLLERGCHRDAHQILARLAADDFAALPVRSSFPAALASLSLVAIGVGDLKQCRSLYGLLRRYENLFAVDLLGFSMGSVQQHLARLAAALDRPACAERHFQVARSENLRTEHRIALAETEAAWAELKS
jgi:DNA-binding winged helix-turn-helix (wHTH) protein